MLTSIQSVTLQLGRRWNDEELYEFCRKNDGLQVERTANGEVRVTSPSGSETGGWQFCRERTTFRVDAHGRARAILLLQHRVDVAGWFDAQPGCFVGDEK